MGKARPEQGTVAYYIKNEVAGKGSHQYGGIPIKDDTSDGHQSNKGQERDHDHGVTDHRTKSRKTRPDDDFFNKRVQVQGIGLAGLAFGKSAAQHGVDGFHDRVAAGHEAGPGGCFRVTGWKHYRHPGNEKSHGVGPAVPQKYTAQRVVPSHEAQNGCDID